MAGLSYCEPCLDTTPGSKATPLVKEVMGTLQSETSAIFLSFRSTMEGFTQNPEPQGQLAAAVAVVAGPTGKAMKITSKRPYIELGVSEGGEFWSSASSGSEASHLSQPLA